MVRAAEFGNRLSSLLGYVPHRTLRSQQRHIRSLISSHRWFHHTSTRHQSHSMRIRPSNWNGVFASQSQPQLNSDASNMADEMHEPVVRPQPLSGGTMTSRWGLVNFGLKLPFQSTQRGSGLNAHLARRLSPLSGDTTTTRPHRPTIHALGSSRPGWTECGGVRRRAVVAGAAPEKEASQGSFLTSGSPTAPMSMDVGVKLAAFYAAHCALHGIRLPYWPLWLSDVQGLSGAEIGLILGASQISRTLTGPTIGLLADSLNKPKQVALTLAVANLVTNLTLLGRHDLLSLSLLCSLSNSLFSAMMPLGESLAVTRLPEEAYGRVRMWGSVGFAAANVLGGQIISTHGAEWMMPISIAGSAALAASCMQLPGRSSDPPADGVETSMTAPISTQRGAIHDYPAAPAQESALREAASLIGNVKYIVFLLAACLIQASHAAYYTFGAIMLQQAGYSGGMIGALWGVGVAAEVMVFAQKRLQTALSAWQLLALGAAASVLRWGVMATNPSFLLLVSTQLLHGFTFGTCHMGCIKFVQTAVPPRISATANAIIGALSEGIFMAGATYLSGQLLATHGFGTFLVMSGLGGAGLAMSLLLGRLWDGSRLKLK